MGRNKLIEKAMLLPMSKLYGMGVAVRNRMFEWHLLKQHKFDIPVVVVGNLSVGGTGKTPHTEYVINALRGVYRIGVLSRGYKRNTRGFIMANKHSTPSDIGDEPYQMYQKYGRHVRVAVCEDRCKGIEEMMRIDPTIDLILLDDAFQHRYVRPSLSIVLMEWNRPIYNDDLLPLGRLREPQSALNRADVIVVTKCPSEIRPMDIRLIYEHLNLVAYQKLYFSHYVYGNPVSLYPDETTYVLNLSWLTKDDSVLVIAGIANPKPFVRYIKRHQASVTVKQFADHHNFTRKNFEEIKKLHEKMPGRNKYIITTEKDAVRIANNPYFPHELKACTFYIPIKVEFLPYAMPSGTPSFDKEIRSIIKSPRE